MSPLMAAQVAASTAPDTGSLRVSWYALTTFWKLLPKTPSISPQEKCARANRICARTTPAPFAPIATGSCAELLTVTGSIGTMAAFKASGTMKAQRSIIPEASHATCPCMRRYVGVDPLVWQPILAVATALRAI